MNDDVLKKTLREAAGEAEFSEELHERVMAGVRRERGRAVGAAHVWRWWAMGAITAGVLAVGGVWVSTVREREAQAAESGKVVMAEVTELRQAVKAAAGPVGERMKEARFAYLDRDGKRLAEYLWRQVPGVEREKDEGGG